MKRVGFDLGTTYSALCFYDEDTGKTDYLKFDSCTRDFFPTLIAYNREDDTRRYVGEASRMYRSSAKYDAYDTFKLSLGDQAHELGGREKSGFQVAQDFVAEVLRKLRQTQNAELSDLVLVQTVPDIWKNELHNKIALDNLRELYEGIGLDVNRVAFESEPVSAAAFYVKEVCGGDFSGHIVVVDYGGGTLDLTLCRVETDGTLSVLYSCGDGGSGQTGCAGSAFDRAMTQTIIEKNGLDPNVYAPGTPAFTALQSTFEDCKIASSAATRTAMEEYYESSGFNDPVAFSVVLPFAFQEFDVYASDIHTAFESVNRQALESALAAMEEKCRELEVDTHSIESFRVLMVGGFSNLYCVEAFVRERFGSGAGIDDPRFDSRMNQSSRSTAIAHGACLIARGITTVKYINQTEIGFYARNVMGQDVAIPVLHRDVPVEDYAEPSFSPHTFARTFRDLPVSLTLYFNGGTGNIRVKMDEVFKSLCPNFHREDNRYQIGFSIDRHRIPQLHIRDISGEENVVSLHKMISNLPAVMIDEP